MAAARQRSASYKRSGGALRPPARGRDRMGVIELQRARMLHSAVEVVMRDGYGQMSVARVTGGAGVSRRTFYELFEDREACFLAAFDQVVNELRSVAREASEGASPWRRQLRSALAAVLELLDEQPGMGSLVIVEALAAGPRVLARRAEVLAELVLLLNATSPRPARSNGPPPLTGEGLVGAVLGVIHTRLVTQPGAPLTELLNPLMGLLLSSYVGRAAAARELTEPPLGRRPRTPTPQPQTVNPLQGLNMRVTHRTLLVLQVIGEHPGASNRRVAEQAGIADQGQASKLLARLEGLGLIDNTTPVQPTGEPNAWHLTPQGRELKSNIDAQSRRTRDTHKSRNTP
jgi:AcrR family transcriptional regulator/DNA-binding MarR family transcriptional regulator